MLGSNPSGNVGASGTIHPVPPPTTGVSGFLGLVQDLQRIRNQEANVAKLNDSLLQLEAAFEAGRIGSRLQVDQARQALFNGQSRLLAAKSSFENRLDGYKIFLGLPPTLDIRVMDDYIQSFRFTDLALVELQDEINLILSRVRDPEVTQTLDDLKVISSLVISMRPRAEESFQKLISDYQSFQNVLPERKKGFNSLRERSDLRELGMGPDTFRDRDLDNLISDLNGSIFTLSGALEEFDLALGEWNEIADSIAVDAARGRLSVLLNSFSGTLLELSLAKASARLESIVMEEIKFFQMKLQK